MPIKSTNNYVTASTVTRRNKRRLALGSAAAVLTGLIGCQTADTVVFDAGRSALRLATGVQSKSVQLDEQHLGYLHRPGSGPTVVLLHGFASEKDVWLRFLRTLPRDYEVIALDLPGHGDSSRNPEFHYDIPAMVGLVQEAVRAVAQPPVHLVGTSLGGMIASLYASEVPHEVATLALYAPAGVYPPHPSEFQRALNNGQNPLIAANKDEFRGLVDIVFYDPPPLIWPVGSALQKISASRAEFHRKIWSDLWPDHPTLNDRLSDLAMPVLLVWGRQDEVLDVSSTEIFQSLLPQTELHLIDQAGHAIINEKPRQMARLYNEFLSAHTHD